MNIYRKLPGNKYKHGADHLVRVFRYQEADDFLEAEDKFGDPRPSVCNLTPDVSFS